jgi:hypothetical protein
VDPDGPAAGILRGGDVILSVNRRTVSSAADAGRELKSVASGRIAQILIWRGDGEVFVTIKKERHAATETLWRCPSSIWFVNAVLLLWPRSGSLALYDPRIGYYARAARRSAARAIFYQRRRRPDLRRARRNTARRDGADPRLCR